MGRQKGNCSEILVRHFSRCGYLRYLSKFTFKLYKNTWAKMQENSAEDAREKVQSGIIIHVLEGGISRNVINKISVFMLVSET